MERRPLLRYRICAFVLAILLLLLPGAVLAEGEDFATPATIVTISPDTTGFEFYPEEFGPKEWGPVLPPSVRGIWSTGPWSMDSCSCPIQWNLDKIGNPQPGLQTITGTVSLPAELLKEGGYQLAEDSKTIEYHFCWNLDGISDPNSCETISVDSAQLVDNADEDEEHPYCFAYEQGTALETIQTRLNLFEAQIFLYNDAYSYRTDILWDLSSVNPAKAGVYTVSGSLALPAVFRLAEGVTNPFFADPPTVNIIISEPGVVDLSNYVVPESGGASQSVRALWSTAIDLANARLEYVIGDGEAWKEPKYDPLGEQDDSYFYYVAPIKPAGEGGHVSDPMIARLFANELQLYLSDLADVAGEEGATFYFRVCYGENQTSDELMVDIPAGWGENAEPLNIAWEGERDFIGREGDSQGELTQPAPGSSGSTDDSDDSDGDSGPVRGGSKTSSLRPDPTMPPKITVPADDPLAQGEPVELPADVPAATEAEPAPRSGSKEQVAANSEGDVQSEPEAPEEVQPPMERITETETTIGGERLRQLMEINPKSVLFEKQGIAVSIPTGYLRELDIGANELLTVRIEPIPLGFVLTLSAGGQAIDTLPETLVRFPVDGLDPRDAYELCRDGAEERIPAVADASAGLLTAHITGTGRHTFIKTASAEPESDVLSMGAPAVPEKPDSRLSAALLPALAAGTLGVGAASGIIWRRRRRKP